MSNIMISAEEMDVMNYRIAIGFLIASMAYALDASILLVPEGTESILNWMSFAASIAAVLWILRAIGPSLWKKVKGGSFSQNEPESFITDTFHKAIIKSWVITLLCLVVSKSLENVLSGLALPADFYFRGLIFIMLFSASVIFLFMMNTDDNSERNEDLME